MEDAQGLGSLIQNPVWNKEKSEIFHKKVVKTTNSDSSFGESSGSKFHVSNLFSPRSHLILSKLSTLFQTLLFLSSCSSCSCLILLSLTMHRSASTSRASEEYFLNMSPQVKGSPGLKAVDDHLPIYDPLSEISKKEFSRLKTAENAVHFIPVVLILCAVVLWFFSNPAVTVGNKADSLAARVEGLAFDGSTNLTENGLLPATEAEELKPIERTVNGGARESPGKSM